MKTSNLSKNGSATVEMMAGCAFIVVPCLLGLAQLCKLDHAARKLQYAAQEGCLQAAIAGDEDPSFRILSVKSSVRVAVLPQTAAALGGMPTKTLKRQYWIATGSGHGEEW